MSVTKKERAFACSVYPEIFPGVHGDVVKRGNITFINILWAKEEGSGQVGKYLDSLTGTVIVDAVVSRRLRGMLKRRGYKKYAETGMRKG